MSAESLKVAQAVGDSGILVVVEVLGLAAEGQQQVLVAGRKGS